MNNFYTKEVAVIEISMAFASRIANFCYWTAVLMVALDVGSSNNKI
jgi:hypothetical protein